MIILCISPIYYIEKQLESCRLYFNHIYESCQDTKIVVSLLYIMISDHMMLCWCDTHSMLSAETELNLYLLTVWIWIFLKLYPKLHYSNILTHINLHLLVLPRTTVTSSHYRTHVSLLEPAVIHLSKQTIQWKRESIVECVYVRISLLLIWPGQAR